MNELYHHGILGQKWGIRHGPPYPLSESKDKIGFNLDIKVNTIDNKYIVKGKEIISTEYDILGLNKDFELTSENAASCAVNINPSGSINNCGSCASAILQNMNGGNYQALPDVPRAMRTSIREGYDPNKLIACYENAYWSEKITDNFGNRRKVSNELESRLLSEGEGTKGIFYAEKLIGNSSGHYFTWAIIDGKIHVVEGQSSYVQSFGVDWHTDFFDEVGRHFDVQDGETGIYYSRLDDKPVIPKYEKYLYKIRE